MRQASRKDKKFIKNMLNQKNYLLALQAIYDLCDPGEYGNYLKDIYIRGGYKASKVHELIRDIDSKILITTNFDKIYESLVCDSFPGYSTFSYTETKSIIGCLRSPYNLIIKAHGNIDDTNKIIFTAQQYYKAQEMYPEFYNLLAALFLTHTIVFIGYSLQDPDINLLLQFLHGSANASSPHYLVTLKGNPFQLIKHWKETYNVSVIEYGDNFDCFEKRIEELRDRVIALREERGMP